jgi:formate-dependent phosphoribosylglycinamide formyltransferase (GAR transformylase)
MRTRTYRAGAFLDAAGRLGLAVTVGTEREQPLARLTPGATIDLDFSNERTMRDRVVRFAAEYPIDAVVGVDDDTTVPAAQVAQELGLAHNSVESVKAARYKDVMRLALSEADLLSPGFRTVPTTEDPHRVAERITYPCVLKPLSLAASRGVIRANNAAEFVAAFEQVVSILAEAALPHGDPAAHQILVEDFIPGREFALEGLLQDGHLTTLALFDKPDPLDGPYFEETIYITPSRLGMPEQTALQEATQQAAAALGLRTGPIHAELRLNDRGPWIVEVAARSIGGLCSKMLRFGERLSLEEIILRQAAGLELGAVERERQPSGVMMIPIPAAGRLHAVHGMDAARAVTGIDDIEISIPCGEQVVPLPRATRYLGFIFATGDMPETVERSLRQAHAHLEFDIA